MAGPQRLISRNLQVESRRKAGLVASLLAGLCIGALPTHAQGATWVGGGGGPEFGLWNAHQNWGEPGLAIPTGTAIFQTHEPTSVTISLTDQHPNPPTNIGSIQFDAGALAYSFTNNTTFDITSRGIVYVFLEGNGGSAPGENRHAGSIPAARSTRLPDLIFGRSNTLGDRFSHTKSY